MSNQDTISKSRKSGSNSRNSGAIVPGKLRCILLLTILLAGCFDSSHERVAVRGTVMIDSRPVDQASIVLTPVDQGLPAIGVLSNGSFEIPEDSGPTAGEFWVRINPDPALGESTSRNGASPQQASSRKMGIPKKFQRNGTIKVTVTPEKEQNISLELTSS